MSSSLGSFAARVHRWIQTGFAEADFDSLALELFHLQVRTNAAYRRYVDVRGVDPARVGSVFDIPAVPTQAFKELELTSLSPEQRTRVFHSSGTTAQKPSRHFHGPDSLALYEASAEAGFRRGFWKDAACPDHAWRSVSLTPPPEQAVHSSLVHMLECVGRAAAGGRTAFLGHTGAAGIWQLDEEQTLRRLEQAAEAGTPVALYGTAFHFVHLIEASDRAGRRLVLPPGSRVLETGGYKGRCREWSKSELRTGMARVLGVPQESLIGEYGMSELSSQGYEVRCDEASGETGFVFPPWAAAVVTDPETGRPARDGQAGLVRVLDLANVWSVMAVQTEDRGVCRGGAIQILGRAPAAEPRGCSLMAA